MNFEPALTIELESVKDLSDKVYGLVADGDAKPPFAVYRKTKVSFKKTLDGARVKTEALYQLFVVAGDYKKLQETGQDVIDKLHSFFGRPIGTGGPMIENVTVEIMGDVFKHETGWVQEEIQLKVNY